jgi:regulatory protein YycI of two-component signal transduction system YycFG
MDLSRAKTVLICTFLILNIFLLYQILLNERGGNTGLFGRKEEMSRLEAALQEAGLSLEVPLPKGGVRLAYMIVEPWHFQLQDIVVPLLEALPGEKKVLEEFNNNGFYPSSSENSLSVYHIGEYQLLVAKEGRITLKRLGWGKSVNSFSIEESEQAARQIINKVSFLNNLIYDYSQKYTNETAINFRQEYEGLPLYAGYLQILMRGVTPAALYFYRLEPVGLAEQIREIIPPSTALLRFTEAYREKEEKAGIVEFSLGFYSQEYDAERWEIPPVWRIRLDNGEIYYINAFTGILEQ